MSLRPIMPSAQTTLSWEQKENYKLELQNLEARLQIHDKAAEPLLIKTYEAALWYARSASQVVTWMKNGVNTENPALFETGVAARKRHWEEYIREKQAYDAVDCVAVATRNRVALIRNILSLPAREESAFFNIARHPYLAMNQKETASDATKSRKRKRDEEDDDEPAAKRQRLV